MNTRATENCARILNSFSEIPLEKKTEMAKRTRITRPYPTHSLQDALPIAETIQRVNGGHPVRTDLLAGELGVSVRSSAFFQKLNASAKYGLTIGTNADEFIELTELGEAITAPGSREERTESIRKSAALPEVFGEFYRIYAGKRMPEDIYASNVLTRDLGVPRELTEECLQIIRRNGLLAGIVFDQSGVLMVGAASVADSEDRRGYSTATLDGANGDLSSEDGTQSAEYRRVDYPEDIPSNGDGTLQSSEGAEFERSTGENGRRRDEAHILIISGSESRIARAATTLAEGLSARSKLVTLDMSEPGIIPDALSESLESARGCVFVWPGDSVRDGAAADGGGESIAYERKTWAALGAAAYRLGPRLVIVWEDSDGAAAGLPEDRVVRLASGESVYPKLMAALVQAGIVRVSIG